MTNEKILELLELNQIEELKTQLMREIIAKNSVNKNQYKAILKLSKIAEKEQRDKFYGKQKDGTYKYIRPALAGAWYFENTTNICNWFWLFKSNKIINGLQVAPKCSEYLQIDKFIPYNDINPENEVKINVGELITKAKTPTKNTTKIFEINDTLFNAEYLLNLYKCFNNKKLKVYLLKNMVILKDDENLGLLLAIRKN